MTITPVLLHGLVCWAFRKDQSWKMRVAKIRMLRWISEHNLKDRIQNEDICRDGKWVGGCGM